MQCLRRFVRRGRAARGDDPDFDLASDVEDGELITWLEKPQLTTALQLLQPNDSKKLAKYLPPGTVADLFEQYAATRVGYKTFLQIYKEEWADVLKFRDKNLWLEFVPFLNSFVAGCQKGQVYVLLQYFWGVQTRPFWHVRESPTKV